MAVYSLLFGHAEWPEERKPCPRVYDEDERGSYSNIIDVYASRLRRKIDEGEEIQLFKTLRGTGYMLEAPAGAGARSRR